MIAAFYLLLVLVALGCFTAVLLGVSVQDALTPRR